MVRVMHSIIVILIASGPGGCYSTYDRPGQEQEPIIDEFDDDASVNGDDPAESVPDDPPGHHLCDDGDPCTEDVLHDDGSCGHSPIAPSTGAATPNHLDLQQGTFGYPIRNGSEMVAAVVEVWGGAPGHMHLHQFDPMLQTDQVQHLGRVAEGAPRHGISVGDEGKVALAWSGEASRELTFAYMSTWDSVIVTGTGITGTNSVTIDSTTSGWFVSYNRSLNREFVLLDDAGEILQGPDVLVSSSEGFLYNPDQIWSGTHIVGAFSGKTVMLFTEYGERVSSFELGVDCGEIVGLAYDGEMVGAALRCGEMFRPGFSLWFQRFTPDGSLLEAPIMVFEDGEEWVVDDHFAVSGVEGGAVVSWYGITDPDHASRTCWLPGGTSDVRCYDFEWSHAAYFSDGPGTSTIAVVLGDSLRQIGAHHVCFGR